MKDNYKKENILPGINLYDWQKECLSNWFSNNCCGIVNVATGAGKTILAVAAIKLLGENLPDDSLKVIIVVPKVFLAGQWLGALTEVLGVKRKDIGLYYGKLKENENRKYMIYVINSARYNVARNVVNKCNNGYNVLLICDECHHFGSLENRKVFDFIKHINTSRYFSLGLSATPLADDELTEYLGGEIYKYGFGRAVRTGVVSDYVVFNISLDFFPWEAEEYYDLTNRLNLYLAKLFKLKPQIKALKKSRFYSELKLIASKGNGEASNLAMGILGTLLKRKETVYLSESRIACTVELIKRLHAQDPGSRIIVFAERISSVEKLFTALKKINISAGKCHSGLNEKARENNLERYKNGESGVLLSCRALDEGFNVPETDVGIIMSTTGSIRQRIQRIGRVLRINKTKDSRMKSVYYLHVGDSSEEEEILPQENSDNEGNFVLTFNLNFINEENDFINEEYDSRCCSLLKQLEKNKTSSGILNEVKYNLKLGAVRADWLLSKSECYLKIKESKSIVEKNYWISMLRIIRLKYIKR